MKLGRFNYWQLPAINPRRSFTTAEARELSAMATPALSDYYARRHRAGDEQAIFEFATGDKTALRARWVVEQLERWQQEGGQPAEGKVYALMRRFLMKPRKTPLSLLSQIITKDQALFRELVRLIHYLQFPREKAVHIIAQRTSVDEDFVSEVYQQYLEGVKAFFNPDAEGGYPWDEVFNWLGQCLDNLIAADKS